MIQQQCTWTQVGLGNNLTIPARPHTGTAAKQDMSVESRRYLSDHDRKALSDQWYNLPCKSPKLTNASGIAQHYNDCSLGRSTPRNQR